MQPLCLDWNMTAEEGRVPGNHHLQNELMSKTTSQQICLQLQRRREEILRCPLAYRIETPAAYVA